MHRNNVFLNGGMFKEVYKDLAFGYGRKEEGLVCKLHKPIYGLHQASRHGFYKFASALTAKEFIQSKRDCSLFTDGSSADLVVLLVHTVDIITTNPSPTRVILKWIRFRYLPVLT